jgi:hypothetical protein
LSPEAQAFWPIYNEYSAMYKVKIGDERVKLIDEYVKNRKTLSDEKAKELVEKWFELQNEKMELLKKYYNKMVDAVGAKRATEWFQINQYIDQLWDLAISPAGSGPCGTVAAFLSWVLPATVGPR